MSVCRLVIPLIPPSVNNYLRAKIVRRGRFQSVRYEETQQTLAYKRAVVNIARGVSVAPASHAEQRKTFYRLRVVVYLGQRQRGDGDNFWKVIADSLTGAGIIHSDAAVRDWVLYVRRDRDNPRTEIFVKAIRPAEDE